MESLPINLSSQMNFLFKSFLKSFIVRGLLQLELEKVKNIYYGDLVEV